MSTHASFVAEMTSTHGPEWLARWESATAGVVREAVQVREDAEQQALQAEYSQWMQENAQGVPVTPQEPAQPLTAPPVEGDDFAAAAAAALDRIKGGKGDMLFGISENLQPIPASAYKARQDALKRSRASSYMGGPVDHAGRVLVPYDGPNAWHLDHRNPLNRRNTP
ncbi:hypothetical protein [Kocuria kalidii]|uniref:hypothetical protein n=1 Tax=Kocuria kalidii TaxID=3376283 RepID=UPI0037B929AB